MAADPLTRVLLAARLKQASEFEYRQAVTAAVDAGHSYSELARVLGISRQSMRVLVERERKRQS